MLCDTLDMNLIFIFLLLILLQSTAYADPLTISGNIFHENAASNINYKAFSNSWVVTFPQHNHLTQADLIIPQLCPKGKHCNLRDMDIRLVECAELEPILFNEGWTNENMMSMIGICDPYRNELQSLQYAVNEVCVERCASVVAPVGLEVLNHHFISEYHSGLSSNYSSDPLSTYDHKAETHLIGLQIRFIFLKRVVADDVSTFVFSIRTTVVQATLSMPEQFSPLLGLQHECSARGFVPPPFGTLDLFLEESGAYVCVTECRSDYVRYPWNIKPPISISNETNGSNSTTDVDVQCRPLPSSFVAVLFTSRIGLNFWAPFASHLPEVFFNDVNDLADSLSRQTFEGDIVLLNIPGSSFDHIKYNEVVLAAVEKMGLGDFFETVNYNNVNLNSISAPNTRRLQQSSGQSVELEGLVITNRVSLQANSYIEEVEEAWRVVAQDLPPSISAVEPMAVKQIDRVANTATEEPGGTSRFIRRVATSSFEFVFVIMACVLVGLVGAGSQKKNNSKSARVGKEYRHEYDP